MSGILIALLPVATSAKEEDPEIKLGDVVVTATRYEKESFDTPLSITVIDQEEIEQKSPQNIGELLKVLPGVEIQHDGTAWVSKPRIRGLSSNRVLILIDGNRYNSHVGALTGGVDLSTIDVEQIEKIEVIHGPASMLYGSDAIGGIINIITKRAKGKKSYLTGSSTFRYSKVNTGRKGRIEIEGRENGLSFLLGLSKRKADDVKIPGGKLYNSQFEDENLDLSLGYDFSDKHTLELKWQRFRGKDIGTPAYTMEERYALVRGIISMPRVNRDLVSLRYKADDLSPWLSSLEVRAYFHRIDHDFIMNTHIIPRIPTRPIRIAVDGKGAMCLDTYGISSFGVFRLGEHHLLTSGMDINRDKADGPSKTDTSVRLYGLRLFNTHKRTEPLNGTFDSLGLFLQDEIYFTERLFPILSLRYDWFRSKNKVSSQGRKAKETDQAFSGSLGVLYQLNSNLHLVSNLTTAFRAPNLKERFYIGTVPGGFTLVGNPRLGPERSFNVDLGIKAKFPKCTGSFTVYLNEMKDLIVYAPFSHEIRTTTYKNVGKAQIFGFEGNLDYNLTSKWFTFLSLSYARGKDKKEGDPLEAIPPLKLITGFRHERDIIFPLHGRLWGELSGRIFSKQGRIPKDWGERSKTPGFAVFDVRIGLSLPSLWHFKASRLILSLENITNKRYSSFPAVSSKGWDDSLIQPGRNFVLSLNFKI